MKALLFLPATFIWLASCHKDAAPVPTIVPDTNYSQYVLGKYNVTYYQSDTTGSSLPANEKYMIVNSTRETQQSVRLSITSFTNGTSTSQVVGIMQLEPPVPTPYPDSFNLLLNKAVVGTIDGSKLTLRNISVEGKSIQIRASR